MNPKPNISVIIPTFNEADHISEVVRNALALGEVFVLDSFSTDGTQKLAQDAGATVIENKFENYSQQKNWGLDNLPMSGDWVFILDADERITPALRKEMLDRAAADSDVVGYFVNRVVIFMGRAIRHGGLYPSWNLRFFKRGTCRYENRAVHEHMIANGPTDSLKEEMLHIRKEPLNVYLSKHIRYADMESSEWVKQLGGESAAADSRILFKSTLRYRQWLRRTVWPRLPLRPLIRFIYMYFIRLGILDGRAGFHLAMLMANYEYMITLLGKEKKGRFTNAMPHQIPN